LRQLCLASPIQRNGRVRLSATSPVMLDIRNQYSPSGAHVHMRRMTRGTVLRHLTTLRLTRVTLCSGFEYLLGAAGCPWLKHLDRAHEHEQGPKLSSPGLRAAHRGSWLALGQSLQSRPVRGFSPGSPTGTKQEGLKV
jgi:hypothetical protein